MMVVNLVGDGKQRCCWTLGRLEGPDVPSGLLGPQVEQYRPRPSEQGRKHLLGRRS